MFGVFPLQPAYGRDYKSKAALQKDWDEGKDFVTVRGQYCSKADFPGQLVEFRFRRQQSTCTLRG